MKRIKKGNYTMKEKSWKMVWRKERVKWFILVGLNILANGKKIKCMAMEFFIISMGRFVTKVNLLRVNSMGMVLSIMISKWRRKWEQCLITMIWLNVWMNGWNIRANFLMIKERDKGSCSLVMGKGLLGCLRMIWLREEGSIFRMMGGWLMEYGEPIN